ncbi:MAG: hypothetical protein P1P84_00710 [Deferrisomatales bacterium]|nr:hypothetical protein [Deferrisomatales bacterium]
MKWTRAGSLVLTAAVAATLVAAATGSWAGDELPFKEAQFFIEYNSSAGDTGVQVFLDDDNWRRITISDPDDHVLFTVKGQSQLGRQGLTELFFESVEPELADLPIVEFLERFPEGAYEFEGIRNDGIDLESEVEFTHVIPCGPEVTPEEGEVLNRRRIEIGWDEVTQVVDPVQTDAAGETVCVDPGYLGQELWIDTYQVIVENDDIHLIVDLPADARQLTVPPELLEENTAYKFEVLAKEESGNQTITESFFCTGPGLSPEECEDLADAL